MGRYMRKAKSGEVAVEVNSSGGGSSSSSQQSTVGVRTRARTLALRRLQDSSSSCYLELRSRRLEKPMSRAAFKEGPNPSPRSKNGKSSSNPGPNPRLGEGEETEASFGENVVDVDAVARNVRETTPCSLIRDSETIATPGSTTRRSNSNNTRRGIQNAVNRNIPTSYEMEEFFACAERPQQRIFTDKYNFDPVNDCPLPGRYEWVKVE